MWYAGELSSRWPEITLASLHADDNELLRRKIVERGYLLARRVL